MNKQLWGQASREAWAILPEALHEMLARVGIAPEERGQGADYERQAVSRPGPKSGRVARIPVMGSISKRASMWSMLFGGATVETLTAQLREAGADPSVRTILLHVDSPGGTTAGLVELAAEIRALRESKHVVALADGLMASAAYWIASQADEIIATPDSLIGSIGVFMLHSDYSQWMEQIGIKNTFISAGKYKTEANPYEPLSDEARAHLQIIVDDAYAQFVGDVAKGRGVTVGEVKAGYGEGSVLTAKDAKAAGLIDRIAGYDETIGRFAGTRAESETTVNGEQPSLLTLSERDKEYVGNSLAAKRLRLELLEKHL